MPINQLNNKKKHIKLMVIHKVLSLLTLKEIYDQNQIENYTKIKGICIVMVRSMKCGNNKDN